MGPTSTVAARHRQALLVAHEEDGRRHDADCPQPPDLGGAFLAVVELDREDPDEDSQGRDDDGPVSRVGSTARSGHSF